MMVDKGGGYMRTVGQSASVGLAMASARFARSAYNVANVNTENFKPRSVGAVEPPRPDTSEQARSAAFADASAKAVPYHGESYVSSTDLTSEAVQQVSAVNAFRANVAMLRAEDDRTARAISIKV